MTDLTLYEGGSGGDLVLLKNDLDTTSALWNNVYLALFGGPIESDHEDREESTNEINNEYWQDNLFYETDETKHLNSQTEIELNHIVINSKGLSDLENTIKEDLEFLNDLGNVSVSVSQNGVDKIEMNILIEENDENQDFTLKYIWDATKSELITDSFVGVNPFVPPTAPPENIGGFASSFAFGLN